MHLAAAFLKIGFTLDDGTTNTLIAKSHCQRLIKRAFFAAVCACADGDLHVTLYGWQ